VDEAGHSGIALPPELAHDGKGDGRHLFPLFGINSEGTPAWKKKELDSGRNLPTLHSGKRGEGGSQKGRWDWTFIGTNQGRLGDIRERRLLPQIGAGVLTCCGRVRKSRNEWEKRPDMEGGGGMK